MNQKTTQPIAGRELLSRRLFALQLVIAWFLAFPLSAQADKAPFSRIIAFGDSLTDTGNFFQLTGLPPVPYYQGRFSNGRVWIEHLGDRLGMQIDPEDNYAVGGATTGRDNENDIPGVFEFPGLQDELDHFTARLQGSAADPDALYVIWAGANDFFVATGTPTQTIATGVGNTAVAVQRLYALGARHLMVVNLPDLGLTPLGVASGNSAGLSYVCKAYNGYLAQALDQLAAAGVPTIRLDAFAVIQSLVAHSPANGLTNVTADFLSTGGDPDEFLFWDAVHPTTQGHELLAEQAMHTLIAAYSPRKGRGMGPGLVNSLNGLVSAASQP